MNVLLLHGQGRTTNAMRVLGFRLYKLGYRVQYFRYYTRKERFEGIVNRFVQWVNNTISDGQPYAIVGHSMGGLIARAGLPLLENLPIHLFLLASPNRPPKLAPYVQNNFLYKYLTTDCGQLVLSSNFYQKLPLPNIPATIIAGFAGPRAEWLPYGFEPNDGALSVQDTSLGSGYELLQVPSIHTFIMNSKLTLQHIERILSES
ncbi:MAG: hypothetical protein U0V18_06845 [Anaerolineales bacterium]